MDLTPASNNAHEIVELAVFAAGEAVYEFIEAGDTKTAAIVQDALAYVLGSMLNVDATPAFEAVAIAAGEAQVRMESLGQ